MMAASPSPQSLDILRSLISFDTTSRNANLEFIAYVEGLLNDLAIPYRLTHDDDKRKANDHLRHARRSVSKACEHRPSRLGAVLLRRPGAAYSAIRPPTPRSAPCVRPCRSTC